MRKLLIILFLLISGLLTAQNKWYVDYSSGNDANAGDIDHPFKKIQKGIRKAVAGDTVFLRNGVHYTDSILKIDPEASPKAIGSSGTAANPIVYMSYPGEWAIIDCKDHEATYGMFHNVYNQAFSINYVEHIKFKDFEIRNVFQLDSVIDGGVDASFSRNLTFDHIIMHQVSQRGFYIRSGAWKSWHDDGGTTEDPYWDDSIDTTRFINCDVYELFDTLSSRYYPYPGNNADAWKCDIYRGNVFIFDGCRAWNYSDDAMDLTNINRGKYFINSCWAMSSNKYYNPSAGWEIEGNGFSKMSSARSDAPWGDEPTFILTGNLAMFCHGNGFDDNAFISAENGWRQTYARFYNNTSYHNEFGFWCGGYTSIRDSSAWRNNLSYDNAPYDDAPGDPPGNFYASSFTSIFESNNSQDWVGGWPGWANTDTVTVTDADFDTVDSLTLVSRFTAARRGDGSLPSIRPLQLAAGSDLINKGTWYKARDSITADLTTLGFLVDSVGSGPDIGYFEYGTSSEEESEVEYPSVSTSAVTSYTAVRATLGGSVTSDGGGAITDRGIAYGTSENPTISGSHVHVSGTTGTYSVVVTGLSSGTLLYVRAFATNETGTSYGSNITFTTKPFTAIRVGGKSKRLHGKTLIMR